MDFMVDQVFNGRRSRLLTLVDNFGRESLAIRVGQRLTGDDVVAVLGDVTKCRGKPVSIRVDNGPEFISKSLDWWAYTGSQVWETLKRMLINGEKTTMAIACTAS